MLNFCTLFNSNYAARGLLMYESLKKTCTNFHLYIFAFDDELYNYLQGQNLLNVTIISLTEFEDERLLKVKKERTARAYCWTCESLTIQYCLNHYEMDHCTYIDADMYFYSNPQLLIDEMGDNDVLLTEHRYTESEHILYGGRFCVQFMCFKNTKNGRKVLDWWCDRCLEWCGEEHINGQFGDQMYLEDWPERFKGIHVLQHLGGGVAPWNMQQYVFYKENNKLKGKTLYDEKMFDVIFFHFHAIKFLYKKPIVEMCFEGYTIPNTVKKYLYQPYIKSLILKSKLIRLSNPLGMSIMLVSWKTFLHRMYKRIITSDSHYFYQIL